MAHNQANGDDAPGPQEDNRYPPLQDANASLKIRLAGIALDRQEKLKAEVCKVIEAYGSRSETEYLIDEYIKALNQRNTLERENSKLKASYTDIHVIKESQFKHLQQLQQLVSHQQRQLLHYQQVLEQPQAQQQPQQQQRQELYEPSQQQQLHLQPLQQEQQNDASSQNSQERSIAQLQGDLEMTIAELTRAMEDVEVFKKRAEALEHTNQELRTQIETKHNVNHELGQILESKIKEHNMLQAEQTKNKAELHLAASLGSLKCYQLYAAIAVISDYYELLAPLVESKSNKALKDLTYLKDLNTGMPPTTIQPGMLSLRMALLRQQIFTESQMLQKMTMELSRASSSSILVPDTPPQLDQATPIPGPMGPTPRPAKSTPGPMKTMGPSKSIVEANQIAPGVQKNVPTLVWRVPISGPHDKAPTETPSTSTLAVMPPTANSSTPSPAVPPIEPSTTVPPSPKTSTAALLQIHKQRMQDQQALNALKNISIPPQHTSQGNAIVIPVTDTASETTTSPTPERDVNTKPSESNKTESNEEMSTLATTRSVSEQGPIEKDKPPVAMHIEGSDALSEKFRAMDVTQPEQGGVSDENIASVGGEPTTSTNPSGDLSITADLPHISIPDMTHAPSTSTSTLTSISTPTPTSTSPKSRQSPSDISQGQKRQAEELSPTRALSFASSSTSHSSLLSAPKRLKQPKFPAFEMPTVSKDKATKSSVPRLSHVGPRPKKGRWFLEAVEVPVWKRVKREESE
ncbi:hypothetical protein BG000_010219 [Podila horticola]|nr:hypothetical protein BG000_010219 [Podila horticola]